MKIYYTLLLSCCLCLSGYFCSAQLYTEAGANRTICRGDSVLLGGADTATNAIAPFTYQWQPATGLSATNVAHPVARPAVTTTYYLTSSDANGVVSVDSVTVTVKFSGTYITASDTLVCPGQQVQLSAFVPTSTCFSTAQCNGNNITPPVGNGTITQPGTVLQGPSLFGNYKQSSRSQMLYTAEELQAVLGGPCVIRALTFNISSFNSNALLQNFTIKMGCAFQDSLTTWNDNLVTVYSAANYQPHVGWLNGFVLQTPFYWDGYSDILIDICNYNPSTFGSQNNKAECTPTAYKSYLYSTGFTNQCGGGTMPTAYYLRPNVKFNYCVPTSPPVVLNGYDYEWEYDNGVSQGNPLSFIPVVDIYAPGYCYFTVSDSTCVWRDSVFINTKSNARATIIPDNRFCPDLSNGSAVCVVNGYSDTISYWLGSYGLSDTLFTGKAVDGDSLHFVGLDTGRFMLHVFDSICTSTFSFVLSGSIPQVSVDDIASIKCYGDSTGKACVTVSNGTPPYQFYWDSLYEGDTCNTTLSSGVHFVLVRDALGCEKKSPDFMIYEPAVPLTVDSSVYANKFYLNITSGTIPYTIHWGDGTESISVATAQHTYNSDGVYEVVVSDMNGCEYTMTVTILGTGIEAIGNGLFIYPNPAGNSLIIGSDGQSNRNIKILDALGRVVLLPEAIAGQVIDISGLATGVYVAAVQTTSGELTQRFVKQ